MTTYLLDTQAFIWMDSHSDRLSNTARALILNLDNELFLSLVSIWEMQIKHQLGKLQLRVALSTIVNEQLRNRVQLLLIQPQHIYGLAQLPLHHRDPFDRLLIAQARAENLTLISSDSRFADYDVPTVW